MRYLTPLGVMLLSILSPLHHRRPSSQGQIISLNLPLILASCEISDTSGGNAAICSLTAASQEARRPSSQGQIISLNLPLILASCEISDTSGGSAAICSLKAASQEAEFSRSDNFSQLTIDLGEL